MPPRLPFRGTCKASQKAMSRSSATSTASAMLQVNWPSSSSTQTQVQQRATSATFHGLAPTGTTTHQEHHHQHHLGLPERSPEPPVLLLLQGDQLHVSPEGIARSCYHLAGGNNNNTQPQQQWTIEEQYHLDKSTKSFVIRCPLSSFLKQPSTTTIQIQEVDTRLAGTGGTTWEASMAMALYFAGNSTNNLQGHGDVVEIGCGVGLGGMLLHHALSTQQLSSSSITLTDGSTKVVKQCRDNVKRYLQQHPQSTATPMQVKRLDWNDVLQSMKTSDDNNSVQQQYNTVIACDCAYRRQDVTGLTETLKALLKREDNNKYNRIHLFGPYNRVAYQDVIERLQQDKDLEVKVEWMELCRYRLAAEHAPRHSNIHHQEDATCVGQFPSAHQNYSKQFSGQYHTNFNDDVQHLEEELKDANKSSAKFLHVIATWKKQQNWPKNGVEDQQSSSMYEID